MAFSNVSMPAWDDATPASTGRISFRYSALTKTANDLFSGKVLVREQHLHQFVTDWCNGFFELLTLRTDQIKRACG